MHREFQQTMIISFVYLLSVLLFFEQHNAMDDEDEEEADPPHPRGYINKNVQLHSVKKHIRMVLTHLFLLWTLRCTVSSRSDYDSSERKQLAFENMKFLWTDESLLSFLRRRQFNYEPLDATSKVQDRIFEKVPKEKKFMIAVLLGIFCSMSTAQVVEERLDEVLAVRTLTQAVEVLAKHARRKRQKHVEGSKPIC